VNSSPQIDVTLETVEGGCGHGKQFIRINNNEEEKWGGVAQDGKWMEKGKTYAFSGYLRQGAKSRGQKLGSEDKELRLKVLLFREQDWENALFEKDIQIDGEFKRYDFEILCDGPTEQVTFAVFIPPGRVVETDAFSLLPEDHFFKWKKATVEMVKKLNPGLIRFPGGCFASFYDWKKGVGPYDERQPEPSYFWGGLNNNDLGTAEFAMLCKEVGCEMMYCINMYHPNKEKYLRDSKIVQLWLGGGQLGRLDVVQSYYPYAAD